MIKKKLGEKEKKEELLSYWPLRAFTTDVVVGVVTTTQEWYSQSAFSKIELMLCVDI
jgi:hypothetical protein